jgi:hypothetical protein
MGFDFGRLPFLAIIEDSGPAFASNWGVATGIHGRFRDQELLDDGGTFLVRGLVGGWEIPRRRDGNPTEVAELAEVGGRPMAAAITASWTGAERLRSSFHHLQATIRSTRHVKTSRACCCI